MSDILRVEGLDFSYGHDTAAAPILKGIDFSVREGDFVAITGPSGSGKSTLFYLLGCLHRPSGGRVFFEERDVSGFSDLELAEFRNRKIGFVFQQFHLLPRATVLENILLPSHYPSEIARPTEADRARAIEVARRLGIEELLDRQPQQLSGGQQQRVAVARALLRDVKLLLADEPTGNLDSQSAAATLELFRELHREGRTIVLITHDREIAAACPSRLKLRDGRIESYELGPIPPKPLRDSLPEGSLAASKEPEARGPLGAPLRFLRLSRSLWRPALDNLLRNKAKSFLTMLGVVIGIAAVLGMVTLGSFVKRKILKGYESLGANALSVQGYANRGLKAIDRNEVAFNEFNWDRDLEPLPRVFPEIELISPQYLAWGSTISYGGKQLDDKVRALGVNSDYDSITDREIVMGRPLLPFDIDSRSGVCTIGARIASELFPGRSPLGEILSIGVRSTNSVPCRVIGVYAPISSNSDWWQPDYHVLIPSTYFVAAVGGHESELHSAAVKARSGADAAQLGATIKGYFVHRYGSTGEFFADSNSKLVSQMKLFLNLFSVLLTSIAFISLFVGGLGINNMMLVAIVERLKEIGLRKALGATNASLRAQILLESLLLCTTAGVIGALLGFTVYEGLIWGASKLIPSVSFEWVFEPWALAMSVGSVVAVGILSGLAPAVKAERLEVIEALRSE